MPYRAAHIARYMIDRCAEGGHPVDNLKLQGMLYHVQERSLCASGTPMFDEDFEAWHFGPVLPEVYYRYCGFGALKIELCPGLGRPSELETINDDLVEIIDPIMGKDCCLTPWKMADDLLRKGGAWDLTFNEGKGDHHVIPKDLISASCHIA